MAKGKYEYWLTPEGLLKLEAWARDGLTDKQIAEMKIGISERTFTNWKKTHSSIFSALKKGKEIIDIQVENSLLKRALGYSYKEVKTEVSDDGQKVITTVKEVIPDVTAQIFWLKNRMPDKWRDKKDIEHGGSVNNPFAELSTELLLKLAGDED